MRDGAPFAKTADLQASREELGTVKMSLKRGSRVGVAILGGPV